jgi:hypothetical protein
LIKINAPRDGSSILLGKREEREMLAQFGEEYRSYQDRVPVFFPKLGVEGTVPQPRKEKS